MDRNGALILIMFVTISQLVSFSTARKFPEGFDDGVFFPGDISVISKTVNRKSPATTVIGCGGGESDHFTARVYVAGNYGSLALNVLPKGSVPASGPSKRTNDVKT